MPGEHPRLSFEQWVTSVFDHPLPARGELAWYHADRSWDDNEGMWLDTSQYPQTTVAYLTTLFENASSALVAFSEAQVNQGFWYLVDNACSDSMFTLLDTRVPWSERKRCLFAMFTLFERFFASRCSPHLSHLDTMQTDTSYINPLNSICYMWWDILPLHGKPEESALREIDAACLEVLRQILDLESEACCESALHGLGHWSYAYRQQVQAIIDAWLARHLHIEDELKTYALAARKGHVL